MIVISFRKNILKALTIFFILPYANASSVNCPANILSSTIYFVPHVNDYCKDGKICKAFVTEVKMQGSGTLNGNKVLTYDGRTRNIGNCNTAVGAAGTCLTPYISVAADDRYYRMGDMLKVPSLKGQIVSLENGKKMTHPGVLVVEDVGGAINGNNRFDLFTGHFGLSHPNNTFGLKGPLKMTAKSECLDRKTFSVVRKNTPEAVFLKGQIKVALENVNRPLKADTLAEKNSKQINHGGIK